MDAECKWLQCTGSSLSLGFRLLSTKAAQRPALPRLVLDARSNPRIFQTFWGCVSAAFLAIAFPMSNPVMLSHCERAPTHGALGLPLRNTDFVYRAAVRKATPLPPGHGELLTSAIHLQVIPPCSLSSASCPTATPCLPSETQRSSNVATPGAVQDPGVVDTSTHTVPQHCGSRMRPTWSASCGRLMPDTVTVSRNDAGQGCGSDTCFVSRRVRAIPTPPADARLSRNTADPLTTPRRCLSGDRRT